ncbi:MAG: calcium/sodium antiporter [Lachnospiraceae bacterium]|nr:calcium/sodium antiporter [Lachnospiraceae bacterium]
MIVAFLGNCCLLILGLIILIKGADIFVEGASGIAKKFHIPQIIIGLTIVAFGTSAPEAAVSISAGIKGTSGIAVGNILGSNIMNILLILGIASCITALQVQESTRKFEIPFMLLVTVALLGMGVFQKELNKISGLILWGLFILFFVYLIRQAKKGNTEEDAAAANIGYKKGAGVLALMTLAGLAAIVLGSNFTVDGASYIAKTLGMSDRIIGLTIVAFGTSLPELLTSVMAAKKGKCDIAIGNIVGSNLFNILFVLGTTSLIVDIPFGSEYLIDNIIAIGAVLLLMVGIQRKKALTRTGGIAMLVSFVVYYAYVIMK